MRCTAMIGSLEIGHKSGKSQGILKWKMSGNPEELQNNNRNKTSGKHTKQSNQLSLPHHGNCKTRKDTKQCTTKHGTNTKPHNGSNYQQQQQQQNHRLKLAWRLPYYCNVSSQRNNIIKLTHYDETAERLETDSQS